MRIDIMTLFPDTVGDVLSESILGRAQERGILRIETHQIRDYTANRQKMPTPWWPSTVSAAMPCRPSTAT